MNANFQRGSLILTDMFASWYLLSVRFEKYFWYIWASVYQVSYGQEAPSSKV